jgi:predicted transcriptional regulator
MVATAGERLPIAEVARRLGLSPKTLRRHAQHGTLPPELLPEKTPDGWYLILPPGYTWPASHRPTPEAAASEVLRATPATAGALPEDAPADLSSGGGGDATLATLCTLAERAMERAAQAMERAAQAEERASSMAAAAAMWQERARNLQAELERALALPAPMASDERPPGGPPPARAPWWLPWRRR